jgi:hypothetical protein
MNTRFKKLALATAVAAGLAVVSLPSQALIVGAAGDALLIPLVVWGNGSSNSNTEFDDVNTVIEVTLPSSIGHEDVANIYTAHWSTPTSPSLALSDVDKDLQDASTAKIKWFWFDKKSVKRKDGSRAVSPDDVVQLNWRQISGGNFNNEPGYMVISTITATQRKAADFAMFGQAYLTSGFPGISASIPVLPMNDGADGKLGALNNVVYSAAGVPIQVSPLVSGSRNNYADGSLPDSADVWVFDLMLSDRYVPTIHVVWLDQNTGYKSVPVNVFDTEEHSCSDNIPLPYELTVTVIKPLPCDDIKVTRDNSECGVTLPDTTRWPTQVKDGLCTDGLNLRARGENVGGYVQYLMDEYQDIGSMKAESSGVAFALKYAEIPDRGLDDWIERFVYADTALANDRGMFK